jgi:hypothetical protein
VATTSDADHAGVVGVNAAPAGGTGVVGRGDGTDATGVYGECTAGSGTGVAGRSDDGRGVAGTAPAGTGVFGETTSGIGVLGVVSVADDDDGHDRRGSGRGVVGVAGSSTGVEGNSQSGVGVWGTSTDNEGIHGESSSREYAAVVAMQRNPDSTGPALYANHAGDRNAAFFKGNVVITGHIEFATADCAEDVAVLDDEAVEAGTVMVLGTSDRVEPSWRAYDRRVAGVIAGGGDNPPAIVLGRRAGATGQPMALAGKVFCKVDAAFGPIDIGDLLTTSPRRGYAMRATDPARAFGAVLGKAMRPLPAGDGTIPVLVALQ